MSNATKTPSRQQASLFRIYNHYRLVVSLLLLALLFVDPINVETHFRDLGTYQFTVVSYAAINSFIGLIILAGFQPNQRHITLSLLMDILILHALLVASSGPRMPWVTICMPMYSKTTTRIAASVARGTLCAASRNSPEGISAVSMRE